MAVHERQNSVVHQTRVKQRGNRVKPEVATVSLARGVFGGDRRTKTETEREQWNAGEFPKTLTPSASIHQYHACPWTWTYNSLYLKTFSSRPFLPVLERIFIYDQISQISFFTTLDRSNIFFSSLQILIIYIEIWHLFFWIFFFCNCRRGLLIQRLRTRLRAKTTWRDWAGDRPARDRRRRVRKRKVRPPLPSGPEVLQVRAGLRQVRTATVCSRWPNMRRQQ
jgi:hypothetical protein